MSLWFCVASVVGPALTFRIRQNEHNMTAAEVAAKAGEAQKHRHRHTNTYLLTHTHKHEVKNMWVHCTVALTVFSSNTIPPFFSKMFVVFFTSTVSEKNFLESETGLKIVQTGVGEVLDAHIQYCTQKLT